jgi:hypothetical protein
MPALPTTQVLHATVGPPAPAGAALGEDLRRMLPPALVEALDSIGRQIQVEISGPIVRASTSAEMTDLFQRLFATFKDYYASTVLILSAGLREDPQRFSLMTVRSFQRAESMVREKGPRWIGQEASLCVLQGLRTVITIAKAATKLFDGTRTGGPPPDKAVAEAWTNAVVAFAMALSCIIYSLNDLEVGIAASAKLGSLATLAQWSKSYAAQAYHLTKELGLFELPPPRGPITEPDDEDIELAETGIESYAELLAHDERL